MKKGRCEKDLNKNVKLDEKYESHGEELLIYAFNTYYQKVFNFFYGHLNNRTVSQDLTGEVFVRAASAWHQYDELKGAVSTWIFTIAQNILKDYLRKKKPMLTEVYEVQDDFNVQDHVENKEEIAALKKAMFCLSEREKEVLQFKYFAGLKNTEIAELTGLSGTNIGVIVHRALQKLRKKLKEYL
ncbi:sigma-70 family RNA polymerase sigma factor [Clostridium sp. AWRP]|uniref:RNA polymerase sigma factor n=1 Tax=Clostridium sp. AWRP TaxID=2212991 RepID=UPI000FD78EB1|nr:sigma-70 family RNA polymerase sigma factor [Clostridium sp. AWRP]AZV56596.1 sigma-70 family RNA polymerase sigma factor [Clostridium sp. AWRP]